MNFLPFLSSLTLTVLLGACASPTQPTTTPNQQPTNNEVETHTGKSTISSAKRDPSSLKELLDQVSRQQNIPLVFLDSGFKDVQNLSQVKKLVAPPPVSFQKNWRVYRSRFVESVRIRAGLTFIEQNRAALEAAESESGVPHQVIAAIIGVETIYGRQMGNFRVKDVLSTLAFDYPEAPNQAARELLFQNQLKDLIILCWQEAKNRQDAFNRCLNQSSSYAGAIGLPQFMPGSILQFATDGDGDGVIDLRNSRRDAIFSVANFLKVHGWQPGMPIYFPVIQNEQTQAKIIELADGQPIAKITVAELIQLGILEPSNGDLLQGGVEPGSKALIVDLPSPGVNQEPDILYVVGLQNFLSIVNYNRSYFYAQSVAEFAQALGYQNKSALARDQIEKPGPAPASKNRSTPAKAVKKDSKAKKSSKPPKPSN
ncbi:lytic murein transglycosylase [Polynucleobacter acidiphobus]|uniref:lytic murein transglycosylase n=1 Tax=Polynucleobacter acidiphobus TaxID=556053 RepID=UPI000D3C69F6|nr:lytic murein transglycosylase [Polynucleobacter acidiphobus]